LKMKSKANKTSAFVWYSIIKRALRGERISPQVLKWAFEKYPPDEMTLLPTAFRFGDTYLKILTDTNNTKGNLIANISAVLTKKAKEKQLHKIPWTLPHFRTYIYERHYAYSPSETYIEIDVTRAYMTAAFKLGLISETFYNKLISLGDDGKIAFLTALGALQQVVYRVYINTETCEINLEKDLRFGYIYNYVAGYFIQETQDIIGLARWVDAWLVREKEADEILDTLSKLGYKAKIKGKLIKPVAIRKGDNYWVIFVIKTENGIKRWIYHRKHYVANNLEIIEAKDYSDLLTKIQNIDKFVT